MKGGPGRIFVFDDDGDDYEDMKTKKVDLDRSFFSQINADDGPGVSHSVDCGGVSYHSFTFFQKWETFKYFSF